MSCYYARFLSVNLCINREIISADYEGIVRGQSRVVGSGVEAQGSREPCGMYGNHSPHTLLLFLLMVIGEWESE